MKRFCLCVVTILVGLAGFLGPVQAQETRFEIAAGADYPLVSQLFEIDQTTAFNVQFGYRFSPRLTVGLYYESQATEDDLGLDRDVDIVLYGVSGQLVLTGDPGLELIAVAAMGVGEIDTEGPSLPGPAGLADTDIDLWYEIGGGAQFARGRHWNFRLQVTARRIKPRDPALVLDGTSTLLVPSFTIGYRF